MARLAVVTDSISNLPPSVVTEYGLRVVPVYLHWAGEAYKDGIDIPPEELLDKVSATPEANSTSITLTFTDGSPTRVAEIANTWGEVLELKTISPEEGLEESIFDKEFKDILLGGTLVVTNEAQVPDSPTMPR